MGCLRYAAISGLVTRECVGRVPCHGVTLGIVILLTGSWGVSARSEDWEGAEEGGVGLLEEAAEGCGGVFRSEDRGKGCESLEVVCAG